MNLVEIDPLASIPKLQYLSLLDNNITKKPNYRLYVIHKIKSLRVLDFIKVKAKVRILFMCFIHWSSSLLFLNAKFKLLLLLHLKFYTVLTIISSWNTVSLQERAEAAALFSSKEAEEEVKKVSREEVQKVPDSMEESETPKVVASTQEQILAIKVRLYNEFG